MHIQELGDKVQSLHEQRLKQLSVERECSRLRQDLDRLAVLRPLLDGQFFVLASALFLIAISTVYLLQVVLSFTRL